VFRAERRRGGVGLNNVGLLVRTWGRYTKTSSTTFTVDDGCGVPLKCRVPGSVTLEDYWTYVAVTGVSSTELIDSVLYPELLVRVQDDITPVL